MRLVLVEARAVDDAGDAPHAGRTARAGRPTRCRAALRGRGRGSSTGVRGRGPELAPVEVAHDLAPDADAVELVGGEVVGQPGDARVHARAAELLVVRLLAGRHLHQRRPAEEHLGAFVDHAPSSRTCRARTRRRPSSCRTRARSSGCCIAESWVRSRKIWPAGMNRSAWVGRSAPPDSTRLISGSRLTVAISSARRFFLSVYGFIDPPRTVGSWAMITHSTPDTTPTPVTMHGADVELGAPRRERRELEERRVTVEEQLDALAREQLAAGAVARLVALAAARDRRARPARRARRCSSSSAARLA